MAVVLLVEACDVLEWLEATGRDETALDCEALEGLEDATEERVEFADWERACEAVVGRMNDGCENRC